MAIEKKTLKPRGRPFAPGVSGNPAGRPAGSGKLAKLRESLAEHVPAILQRLAQQAKEGDNASAKLILERYLPPQRPTEPAEPIDIPENGTLTEKAEAVLRAVAVGDLAPSQGAALLSAVGNLAKATEIDELARRIAQLEAKTDANA